MSDMRTAIQNAITKLEAPEPAPAPAAAAPVETAAAVPAETAAPTRTAAERARDDAGRFAPKAEGAAATAPAAEAKPTTTATAPKYRPPASWKPAIREKWAGIPEDVQEEIDRTEREAKQRIGKAAEAERGYGAFRQAITPFEAQLRASGKAVPEALADALAFAAKVRNGSPQERAAALADVIAEATQAGVGLEAIDQALSSRMQGTQPQPAKPQDFRDPRFDKFLADMQARERARTSQTVQDFAAQHEFFADVQDTVAGLLEAGVAKDLPSAYDAALKLHPEISGVLEQRKAAEAARTGNAATERAVQAASSVRASPVSGAGPKPTSRRDIIASHM